MTTEPPRAPFEPVASDGRPPINFISVCSGIEAASEGWKDLPFRALAYSEIEPFPCAVLAHRHPTVPNLGDMTKFNQWKIHEPIHLLVGGTPCQSFSVAGLRRGLADPRGNLCLTFLGMVERFRPRWVVWENVPGVLSSWTDAQTGPAGETREGRGVLEEVQRAVELLAAHNPRHAGELRALVGDGDLEEADQSSDLDCFLAGLAELGYGFAYRVLDAQHFGVAQRRRRVFVVAHAGGWQPAAAVLLEPEGLRWDPPPGRGQGERGPGSPAQGVGGRGSGDVAGTLTNRHNQGSSSDDTRKLIAQSPDVAPTVTSKWAKGSGGPAGAECGNLVRHAVGFPWQSGLDPTGASEEMSPTLVKNQVPAVAIQTENDRQNGSHFSEEVAPAVRTRHPPAVGPTSGPISYGAPVDTTGHQGDHVVGDGDTFPCLPAGGGNNGGGPGALVHTDKGTPCVDMGGGKGQARVADDKAPTLNTSANGHAILSDQRPVPAQEVVPALHTLEPSRGDGRDDRAIQHAGHVRRLTPVECERLQGFPDNHTLIPGDWRPRDPADRAETVAYLVGQGLAPEEAEKLADCPDGPRYKACGNSMCTLVMRWIGARLDRVDRILWECARAEGKP